MEEKLGGREVLRALVGEECVGNILGHGLSGVFDETVSFEVWDSHMK
ncbi:hypothetical protein [Bartonella sp. CR127HXZ]